MLYLDSGAHDIFRNFERELEPKLGEFGTLGTVGDWAGKLAGAVGRIAGLLHMANCAGLQAPWDVPVDRTTMEKASFPMHSQRLSRWGPTPWSRTLGTCSRGSSESN